MSLTHGVRATRGIASLLWGRIWSKLFLSPAPFVATVTWLNKEDVGSLLFFFFFSFWLCCL